MIAQELAGTNPQPTGFSVPALDERYAFGTLFELPRARSTEKRDLGGRKVLYPVHIEATT